jgi:hypothetical protein
MVDNAQRVYALAAVFDQCPSEEDLGPHLTLDSVRVDYRLR